MQSDNSERGIGNGPSGSSSAPQPNLPGAGPQLRADEILPPVKPPSAAFLMQLFFIPLIIVSIIVSVWLLFSWVAHMSTRPEDIVRNLRNLNQQTWQEAVTMADLLRDPSQGELRKNTEVAQTLTDILLRELKNDIPGENDPESHADFRIYLSRALGLFDVPTGLPALRAAALHENNRLDIAVRRGALQSIALLAGRLKGQTLRDADTQLVADVIRASQSTSENSDEQLDRGQLRATAAFALGLIGGPEAAERLAGMLGDPFPDARYNAATGLARQGDGRAVPGLLEMLNPANTAYAPYEEGDSPEDLDERLQPRGQRIDQLAARAAAEGATDQRATNLQKRLAWKRDLVFRNALEATTQLIELNPAVRDNPDLRQALTTLGAEKLSADIAAQLKALRNQLGMK